MDIEQARFNMIEQQIRPWDVPDPQVLDTLALVQREIFLPPHRRDVAFADVEVPIEIDGRATGETMLAPRVDARMLQAVAPRRQEMVLEIGTGTGYATALLARHARQVTSVEIRPELVALATANLRRAGVGNARVVEGDGASLDLGRQELFDVVVVSGSISKVPETLLSRVQVGGRLVAVVGNAPAMVLQLRRRESDKVWSQEDLFETVAPRLRNFPEHSEFRF